MKKILACIFILFAATSIIFEPYIVFNKIYNHDLIAWLWRFYAGRWDPLFLHPPLYMRVMTALDLFIFGPMHIYLVWALFKNKVNKTLAMLYSGAIIYSTLVYFLIEFIEKIKGTNLLLVLLINIPYTIIPIWLVYMLRNQNQPSI